MGSTASSAVSAGQTATATQYNNLRTDILSGHDHDGTHGDGTVSATAFDGTATVSANWTFTGTITVGVDDTGKDVKMFGATAGSYWLWDESADGVVQIGTLTVGVNDAGHDVKFFGATSGAYMLWDESADDLVLAGAAGIDLAGDIDVDGTANLDVVDIDGNVQIDGTVTVGVDDTGKDVKFFGATSGAYLLWDESADKLLTAGNTFVDIVKDKLMIGSTAVTTTAAELNVLDAVTAGTVTASLGVVVDSNKDIGTFRNITLSGELNAGSLAVSGNADIDGTTNLDAVDIDGAVQIDATVTVGADDQGYDIIFYGDTASANVTWDTSVDDLIFNGAARIVVPQGQLVLGSTAVSSTAAELNLLDGVSGLVQADLTKLAAIDATAAELNLLDGSAKSTSSITIADADAFVVIDGTTTKQIPASDIKTYAGGTAADDIGTGDGAVNLVTTSGNITIDAQANDTDVIIKVDDNGSAVTAVTFDGSDEGNAIFVNDVQLKSDSAVLEFGADLDTTLTHTDGTGLTLNSTNKLAFGDTGTFIHQSSDGVLTIASDTTVDIDGAVVFDGAITGATNITLSGELDAVTLDLSGAADIAGDLVLSGGADGALQFTNAGENSIKIPDNQASALIIEEADNAYITFTTTNSSEAITVAKNTTFSGIVDITDATDATDATGDTGALRTEGGASIAKTLWVGTNLDVDGTAELDNITIGGAQGSDGQVLTSTGSAVAWEDAGGGATFIDFAADQTLNNDNSLQNDDYWIIPVAANKRYGFHALLKITTPNTTAGFSWDFSFPSGCTGEFLWLDSVQDRAAERDVHSGAVNWNYAANPAHVVMTGYIENSSTAGNVTWQWAQINATAVDTKVHKGSWLAYWQLN